MTRRWLVLTALAVVAFLAVSNLISAVQARPAHRQIAQPGPLVVVSMPGLTWKDASAGRTPALWSLAHQGAIGNVATRAISPHSCSMHSWMTLSAGARATLGPGLPETPRGGPVPECPRIPWPKPLGEGAKYEKWEKWRTISLNRPIKADLGRLATTMRGGGQCISAVGPGAAIGAADSGGLVARFSARLADADLTECPITFISLEKPNDHALGDIMMRAPEGTTFVVTGMADDYRPESLRAVVVSGPGVPHGLLRSPATRQPGLLQTTDLTALTLSRVDPDPAILAEGRVPVVQPNPNPDSSINDMRDVSSALYEEHRAVAPFFYTFAILALLGVVAGFILRGRTHGESPGRRQWLARWWFSLLGAGCGAVPVSTFLAGLVPWWKTDRPAVWMSVAIVAIAAVVAMVTLLGPWRRWVAGPAVFLAALTATVIALDVTHGSRLQFTSIMGLQPVYGGRYYGMGNVGYALFASTSLFTAALLAGRWIQRGERRLAGATVAVIGLAAVVIDGYPAWGADAGGPLALVPAFAYLGLNAVGLKVTWQRILAVGGVALVLVGGLGYLDYLRPKAYRTHLGDFVATLLEEGRLTGLQRNITANLTMLSSQWINYLVPVLLLVVLVMLIARDSWLGRPLRRLTERVTFLGHGLAAITICWLIGFAVNDSGTAIPPSGMAVVVPLVILVAASTGRLDPSRPGEASDDRDELSPATSAGARSRGATATPPTAE